MLFITGTLWGWVEVRPITRVEPPVLVNAGARDGVSPAPIAITPGRDAMMRFWVCWPSVWGFCSRLCRAVRVLTGGRVPPGAEICVREGLWRSHLQSAAG